MPIACRPRELSRAVRVAIPFPAIAAVPVAAGLEVPRARVARVAVSQVLLPAAVRGVVAMAEDRLAAINPHP